jgi:hypothetical protein
MAGKCGQASAVSRRKTDLTGGYSASKPIWLNTGTLRLAFEFNLLYTTSTYNTSRWLLVRLARYISSPALTWTPGPASPLRFLPSHLLYPPFIVAPLICHSSRLPFSNSCFGHFSALCMRLLPSLSYAKPQQPRA